jgi:hypothetical protein
MKYTIVTFVLSALYYPYTSSYTRQQTLLFRFSSRGLPIWHLGTLL